MTLRKLCNHPDLVTNDYSTLVAPSKQGRKGSTQDAGRSHDREMAVNNGGRKEREEEEEEFVVVKAMEPSDDEGLSSLSLSLSLSLSRFL